MTDGNYLLLCGERRFLAAYEANLETIPAGIVDAVTGKDEILAYQLTENLQREDLNPIDQARGILAYIQAKHPDKDYDLDGVMSELVSYNRRQKDVSEAFASTEDAILQISGKAYTSLFRTLSLLKLVSKIQAEIVSGKLPVSQGYLFAANLGCPDFYTIFDEIMEKPVTNAKLERMLTTYKKGNSKDKKPIPIKKKVEALQNAKTYFEKKNGLYIKSKLQTYLDELRALVSFMEEQVNNAPETMQTAPIKGPTPAPS